MSTDHAPLAGRAATPAPPNVGQSSLGAVLGLEDDPLLQSRRWIHTIVTPALSRALESNGLHAFPAVPGLAAESIRTVPARAFVVEDEALETGPWAGAGSEFAPELVNQLTGLISTCHARSVPVFRIRDGDVGEYQADEDRNPMAQALEDAVFVAHGTAMFEGTEEGAPSSRLVAALQSYLRSKHPADN